MQVPQLFGNLCGNSTKSVGLAIIWSVSEEKEQAGLLEGYEDRAGLSSINLLIREGVFNRGGQQYQSWFSASAELSLSHRMPARPSCCPTSCEIRIFNLGKVTRSRSQICSISPPGPAWRPGEINS